MNRIASLLALPLLAACATVTHAADSLTGTAWRVVAIDGKAPVSNRAGVEFLPDRISATAGCNGMGGEWKVDGNRIISGPFMSTMMYCDGLMEQERAMAQLFEAGPTFVLSDGRLELAGGGHRLELHKAR